MVHERYCCIMQKGYIYIMYALELQYVFVFFCVFLL